MLHKKSRSFLMALMSLPLILTSCNNRGTPKETEEIDSDYYFIFGDNFDTKCHYTYKNQYFREDTGKFDKDFAMMSFIAAANSGRRNSMKKFYDEIYFDIDYVSPVYDEGCKEDTYGYILASRVVDDFTVISLSFRSFDYTLEWVSNVTLGKEGNHEGFEYSCNNALEHFKSFVPTKYQGKKLKLWINGFSRGGALANMFTTKLMADNNLGFNEDNTYCYTFEAPAPFAEENANKDLKNIWNCVNTADIVVNVPPSQYGFARSGTDIDIFRDDFDELFADYMYELYPEDTWPKDKNGEKIPYEELTEEQAKKTAYKWIEEFSKFSGAKKYGDERGFMQAFIEKLISVDDPTYGIQDREHYVDHMQTTAKFACKFLFGFDQYDLYFVKEWLTYEHLETPAKMLKFAGAILEKDGKGAENLYKILKRYLDFTGYDYKYADLQSLCINIYNILMNFDFGNVMTLVNALPNIMRALYFHWHESSYVLLRALDYVPEE